MFSMNTDLLKRLVYCHSTPGEEDEVISLLDQEWRQHAGWRCRGLGRYAFLAEQLRTSAFSPGRILICAHADSPGYIVDTLKGGYGTAVPLGSPHFNGKQARMVVKTENGKIPVVLQKVSGEEPADSFRFRAHSGIRCGDRMAFAPCFTESKGGAFLTAPFLDNRAGCYLLCELLASLPEVTPCQIVVAVTGAEEFTGFGARVLAQHLQADLVLCLDTTYSSKAQEIELQKGPVLTLSDKSVLVATKVREVLQACCRKWEIPLQAEVYNFSGTDARAFPEAGSLAAVLPLLIPSDGNHSPRESIAASDLQQTLHLLQKMCTEPDILTLFQQQAFTWSLRE